MYTYIMVDCVDDLHVRDFTCTFEGPQLNLCLLWSDEVQNVQKVRFAR